MKRIAFLMIALFMIGGVVMAQGQRGEHKKMTPAERAERMTERMVKEYSLNDAQKKQLLKEAHRQKTGVHHGSCGFGIGETMDYALRFPDHAIRLGDFYELSAQDLTDKAVTSLRWYMSTYAELIEEVRANSDIKADYVLDWFNDFDSMTEFREVMNRVCEVEKANLSLISIRPMSDAEWHSQLSQGGILVS